MTFSATRRPSSSFDRLEDRPHAARSQEPDDPERPEPSDLAGALGRPETFEQALGAAPPGPLDRLGQRRAAIAGRQIAAPTSRSAMRRPIASAKRSSNSG